MIGIYHSKDLDGFTSGAIIKLKYPSAKMIGHDYGNHFDLDINNEPIIMADISLPMETMLEVSNKTGNKFTWIDHHISAINDYDKFMEGREPFCTAVLENGVAACEGTWKHLFPENDIPLAVRLLGEYDTWRKDDIKHWEEEVLPFQFGMRLHCNSAETFPVDVLFYEYMVYDIMEEGRLILKYQTQQNEFVCKRASFERDFDGLRAICINGGGFSSDAFKSVYDESKHDIMMTYQFNGKHWSFSIYTTKDDIDCSAIAKKRGGGGHKKAAGFEAKDLSVILPFITAHNDETNDDEVADFPLHEELYGSYVRALDRFGSVHIWSKELAMKNRGRFDIELITRKEFDNYK